VNERNIEGIASYISKWKTDVQTLTPNPGM
ncbi:unnamed protein product, partial [Didymodactylos carnosus]